VKQDYPTGSTLIYDSTRLGNQEFRQLKKQSKLTVNRHTFWDIDNLLHVLGLRLEQTRNEEESLGYIYTCIANIHVRIYDLCFLIMLKSEMVLSGTVSKQKSNTHGLVQNCCYYFILYRKLHLVMPTFSPRFPLRVFVLSFLKFHQSQGKRPDKQMLTFDRYVWPHL